MMSLKRPERTTTLECTALHSITAVWCKLHWSTNCFAQQCSALHHSATCPEVEISKQCGSMAVICRRVLLAGEQHGTARVGAGLPKAVWHQYAHPDYIWSATNKTTNFSTGMPTILALICLPVLAQILALICPPHWHEYYHHFCSCVCLNFDTNLITISSENIIPTMWT